MLKDGIWDAFSYYLSDCFRPVVSSRRLSSCENRRSIQWEIPRDPEVGLGTLLHSVVIVGYPVSCCGPAEKLVKWCPHVIIWFSRDDPAFSLALEQCLDQNFVVDSLYVLGKFGLFLWWRSMFFTMNKISIYKALGTQNFKHYKYSIKVWYVNSWGFLFCFLLA